MALPPLPSRKADAWDVGPAYEKSGPIFSVSARAGRVVVGSNELRLLRAGAHGWLRRDLPDGIGGLAWTAAQEPFAPWRQAVAGEEGVAILLSEKEGGRIAHIEPDEPDVHVTSMAWGRMGARSALYVLWSTGAVACLLPDESETQVLDLPPIVALASDDGGAVGMISWEAFRAYVTTDGASFTFRSLEFPKAWYDELPATFDDPFHVAVSGKALAFSIGWRGTFVSRDVATSPFEPCGPLDHAGALAFEGTAPDAALFGATCTEELASIVRVDASGKAIRVGDIVPEGGVVVPLDEIAWDASRRRLFAVHRTAGLLVATAPDAKNGKLALSS